jgi:hypothetical protein
MSASPLPKVDTCHWIRLPRRSRDGSAVEVPVFICEYPYRTMLLEKPAPGECAGCPSVPGCGDRRLTLVSIRPRMADAPLEFAGRHPLSRRLA